MPTTQPRDSAPLPTSDSNQRSRLRRTWLAALADLIALIVLACAGQLAACAPQRNS